LKDRIAFIAGKPCSHISPRLSQHWDNLSRDKRPRRSSTRMRLLFDHCLIQINTFRGVGLAAIRPESCVVTVIKRTI
ncbi:hypothetical protein, partial [Pseudomonas sp. A-RE-8]|uniref:hypothetical protein n=1 Tax=Pseudomonas sp. A-RE-8 TaxID=2832369 RepID=UPI001CBB5858